MSYFLCVKRFINLLPLASKEFTLFTFIVRPWEFWMYPASCFDLYHASLLDTQFSCWWLDLFSLSFLWGHNSGAILLSESKNRIWVSGEVQVPLQNSQPVGFASSGHRESSQQVYHQVGSLVVVLLSSHLVCVSLWRLTQTVPVLYLLPLPKADCDLFFPICVLNSPEVAF